MTTAVSQASASKTQNSKDSGFRKPLNASKSQHQVEYERKMSEYDGRISYLRNKIDELKGNQSGNSGDGSVRGKLLDELKRIREQARPLQDQRRFWIKEAGELRDSLKKRSGELNAAKEKLPFKTIPEIDAKIASYENQLETSSFKLSEEKHIVAEISKLNKARRALLSLNGNDVLTLQARLDDIQEKIKSTDASNNEFKEKMETLSSKIAELDGARNASKMDRTDRQGQIEKYKKELDEVFETKRRAFEENKAFKAAAFEARLKRQARWKEEKRQQEIAEKINDLEERLQAYNPESVLDKKLSECQNMVTFFSTLSGQSSSSSKEEKTTNTLAAHVGRTVELSEELANAIPIKKDDNEVFFAGTSKKKNTKKSSSTPIPNDSLPKLPLYVLTGLGDLNLAIPSTSSQIPILLEALDKIKTALIEKKAQVEASGQVEIDPKQKALINQIAALKLELETKPNEEEENGNTE
jgi:uncharacterized coiled-coil DUF342 family protein